ncbi:MAG TPA: sugar ABC transporter permease [Tepidisphaeraceae bacterium]|jgi:multiple sugar transport system permease protein
MAKSSAASSRELSNPSSAELRATAKGLAFISPWIIGFALFTAVPIGLSLYYSFCDFSSLTKPPVFIGLDNYRTLMRDEIFWISVRNTAYYAAVALPVGLVVSLGVAMLLNTRIRGLSIYRTIVFLPSLVPAVASAMLWLWLFNAKLGLINVGLRGLGWSDPPAWLSDPQWSMPALILMSIWGVGNTVVIYLAGLQDVPRELYEAADIDGATALRKAWHVTLPTISPVIFFNLIMGIIGTLQVFSQAYIVTAGGPARSTYFYTMYLYDNAFQNMQRGYASAMAWIQLLVILALTAFAAWTSKKWVHYGGK